MSDTLDDPTPEQVYATRGSKLERYLARRKHRLDRAKQAEKRNNERQVIALATTLQAAREREDRDFEFEAALSILLAQVKRYLSPAGIKFLESVLDDDAKAGSVRWRELSRLDLWLSNCDQPKPKSEQRARKHGFTRTHAGGLASAKAHPHRLFLLQGVRVPGRIKATVYGVANRAGVHPNTVLNALLVFGLERLAQSLRHSKEVPPATPDGQYPSIQV